MPAQIHRFPAPGRAARHRCRGRRVRGGARRCRRRRRALPVVRHHVPRRRAGRAHRVAVPRPRRACARRSAVVVAERDSPKPPPGAPQPHAAGDQLVRRASGWCWPAPTRRRRLGLALAGASINEVPAAGVEGRKRTVFFVDQEAAAEVPENLIDPAVLLDARRTRSQRVAPRSGGPTSCSGVVVPRRARSCSSASSRSCSASSRCGAPSRTRGASCTARAWPAAAGCPCRGRRAGPSCGESMMSGISSSGRFAAK